MAAINPNITALQAPPPDPIQSNMMQDMVLWIRDPTVSLIAKIAMVALGAFVTLAAGAIIGAALPTLTAVATITLLWGIREYALQVEQTNYTLDRRIASLRQELAYLNVKYLFGPDFDQYLFFQQELHITEEGFISIGVEDLEDSFMQGFDQHDRPFVVMKITRNEDGAEGTLIIHQRYTNRATWVYIYNFGEEDFQTFRLTSEALQEIDDILTNEHATYSQVPQQVPFLEENGQSDD